MEEPVRTIRHGPDWIDVVLNRPHRANALDAESVSSLSKLVMAAYRDGTRLMSFSGSGDNFCAGFDIKIDEPIDTTMRDMRLVAIETLLQLVAEAPFITIAIVHGAAIGAGADLVASCDYRIATAESRFRFPGFRMTGVLLGSRRLGQLIGKHRALDLILRGEEIGSQIALGCGLVSEIMNPDEQTAYVAGLAAAVRDVTKGSIAGLKSALSVSDGRMDLSRIPFSLCL